MNSKFLTGVLAFVFSATALAQVTVTDPWVRGTVPAQKVTGAFMKLVATQDAKLVGVESSVAKIVEVHEMRMEGDVMKMRAIASLDLPAKQAVELRPGSYHIMLIDLYAQMQPGETVPLTLIVEYADGKRENVPVEAMVTALGNPRGKSKMAH